MEHKEQDILIINKILHGDRLAFKELYNKYSKFYLLTCLRYVKTKEDAEDLVQESFVKIYKDLHQYDASKSAFLSWSKRVVINTCLMFLRKKSVFNFMDNIVEMTNRFQMPSQAVENLNLQDLTRSIQALPKGYRTVFNMHVIDGYTHAEIADKLNISESTSKSQLFKAKKQLRINIDETELKFVGLYA